jgi:hypothetical protein
MVGRRGVSGVTVHPVRDPRPRFQAWLSSLPFAQDATIVAAFFFVLTWPLFVLLDLADGSAEDALTLALVVALPMGGYTAFLRRKKQDKR